MSHTAPADTLNTLPSSPITAPPRGLCPSRPRAASENSTCQCGQATGARARGEANASVQIRWVARHSVFRSARRPPCDPPRATRCQPARARSRTACRAERRDEHFGYARTRNTHTNKGLFRHARRAALNAPFLAQVLKPTGGAHLDATCRVAAAADWHNATHRFLGSLEAAPRSVGAIHITDLSATTARRYPGPRPPFAASMPPLRLAQQESRKA